MRIITWNINGIRATNKSSSMRVLLNSLEADIICLQETKITRCLLLEDIANVDGYLSFFSFSRKKGGYSGVVTYCKKSYCPVAAEEGLSGYLLKDNRQQLIGHSVTNGFSTQLLKSLDGEGRAVLTEHNTGEKNICIINVYCPRADVENKERYLYKMNFYQLLEARCKSLIQVGKHVIIVGDLNVSHRRIDHCDPGEEFELNVARQWLNGLLGTISSVEDTSAEKQPSNSGSHDKEHSYADDGDDAPKDVDETHSESNSGVFLDIFRMFHPLERNAFTCWNTMTGARQTNYGTRIDYILANCKLSNQFTDCRIRPDILGSDHCPVQCDISVNVTPSTVIPELCAIFMPELSGRQASIKSYFSNKPTQTDYGDLTLPKKRSNLFPHGNTSKCRKLSDNKESKSGMFKYFKSNKCEAATSDVKEGESVGKNKDLMSEEIWNSANYVSTCESKGRNSSTAASWKNILKGPEPCPLCHRHKEKSVLRTVKYKGPNLGRQFYSCNRPMGDSTNKEASCGFFQWKN